MSTTSSIPWSSQHEDNDYDNNEDYDESDYDMTYDETYDESCDESCDENVAAICMIDMEEAKSAMKSNIESIAQMLNIPISAVLPSLQKHGWDKEKLTNSFFTEDKQKRTKDAGVYHRINNHEMGHNINRPNSSITCIICFDIKEKDNVYEMPCGHAFCTDCWNGHITAKLNDGPSCVTATCPNVKCSEVITEEEVNDLAPKLLHQFVNYQVCHYINGKNDSKFCPGPGCDRIATFSSGGVVDSEQVTCEACKTQFCLGCDNGPHLPLRCHDMKLWVKEEFYLKSSEMWISKNTQPCPRCNVPIEKNQGCNHMTCSQCRHEFCWICLGDYRSHDGSKCNRLNAERQ